MNTWKQAVLIGIIGTVAALGVNTLRAGGLQAKPAPPLTTQAAGADTMATASAKLAVVSFEEVDALFRKELAIFVDSREAVDFDKGHIPGAVNVPLEAYKSGKQKLLAPKGSLVVIYCSGGDCELSHDLARLLSKAGFQKVRVYVGGWDEWDALGQPVEK